MSNQYQDAESIAQCFESLDNFAHGRSNDNKNIELVEDCERYLDSYCKNDSNRLTSQDCVDLFNYKLYKLSDGYINSVSNNVDITPEDLQKDYSFSLNNYESDTISFCKNNKGIGSPNCDLLTTDTLFISNKFFPLACAGNFVPSDSNNYVLYSNRIYDGTNCPNCSAQFNNVSIPDTANINIVQQCNDDPVANNDLSSVCSNDSDCSIGYKCIDSTYCGKSCSNNLECPDKSICDNSTNVCKLADCKTDSDCSQLTQTCNTSTGTCIERNNLITSSFLIALGKFVNKVTVFISEHVYIIIIVSIVLFIFGIVVSKKGSQLN